MTQSLPKPIIEYLEASNTFDGDRLIAAFADDAMVNDARREFWGVDAIKRWSDTEIIGDKVTFDVKEVREHYGEFIVDAVVDGNFDKSKLPDVIVLTHYFTIRDDKIVSLIIILNAPAEQLSAKRRSSATMRAVGIDHPPHPDIAALIGTERHRLLEVLDSLRSADWPRPTPCPEWNVLELCCHLVGVDFSSLSRNRDHHHGTVPPDGLGEAEFIRWIDNLQMEWVNAARRLSPRMVIDLLAWSAPQLVDMFDDEDPAAYLAHVSWAGPDPVPVWLNQIRELSEYWIHRQQLLQALELSADLRPELVGPVLEGLRWAYPYRLGEVPSTSGDTVVIAVTGPYAATWYLVATASGWDFSEVPGTGVVAGLSLTTDQAWRLLSNNLRAAERAQLEVSGDPRILDVIMRTRAIIGSPG